VGFLHTAERLAGCLEDPAPAWLCKLSSLPAGKVALLDALVPLFLSIRDRHGRLVPLVPNAAQREYARRRGRRNIVLKARQLGITTYIAGRCFLSTILRPGIVALQVAHSLESAQQIFRVVHRFADSLHPDIQKELVISRANVREVAFAALDSRYIVDTAGNRNAGRGLTIYHLHGSEVAQWPGAPQETLAALMAAVPAGGTVDLESTPRGSGGYFHTEWLRARRAEGASAAADWQFTPHFFPWWIEPEYRLPDLPGESLSPLSEEEQNLVSSYGLDAQQIRYRRYLRRTYGDLAPQEFAEDDLSCFLASGRSAFDVAVIEARLKLVPPPIRVALNGAECTWLEAQPGRDYIIGADVAEGTADGDFSAAVVLDAETGLQCAELLARWPLERFAAELARLGTRYNQALLAIERNNQGHAILYALRHTHGYPRIYAHPEPDGRAKLGWPMNLHTKPLAINMLGRILREAPQVFASQRLLEQCRAFVYHDNGEACALPGSHDDLVVAAAIAVAVRAQAASPQWITLQV